MKALSEDLRVRVVEAREAGESIAKVAERFSVSLSSVKRLRRQIREQGRLDFRSPPGRPARFEGDTLDAFAAQLREHNDWTLKQRTGPEGAVLSKTASTGLASGHGGTGGSVHPAPDVSKVELDLEKKRNAPLAGRPHGVPFCPRQRNEAARWQFLAQLQQIDPYKVVLFDETGTRLGMTPARARSPKGERAHSPERRNTGKNHTLLSAVSLNGVLPDLLLEGGVNRISFEFYLEHLLLPQMQPGQILRTGPTGCRLVQDRCWTGTPRIWADESRNGWKLEDVRSYTFRDTHPTSIPLNRSLPNSRLSCVAIRHMFWKN